MTEPETVVTDLFNALERRDLDTAARFLAPDVEMIFPGGVRFTSLSQLVEWGRPRYRSIAKRLHRLDSMTTTDGDVVICQGVLYGEWLDGGTFNNIRFADWFLIVDGLIRRQHVWNDLAETRALMSG